MLILRVGSAAAQVLTDPKLLLRSGIRSEYADTGADALELISLYDYDLILTGTDLKDMAGRAFIRRARATGCLKATIVLAGQTTTEAAVQALNDGADDFVRTQCDTGELLARMRAVVRRSKGHDTSALRHGSAELNLSNHDMHIGGQKVPITRREFSVLELLFMKQGSVVTKEDFLNHLYIGYDEPDAKALDIIICRLRKKLVAAGSPDLIETVWGTGYMLQEPTGRILQAA
jgi:two-component system cell cycle response regulator CtrA